MARYDLPPGAPVELSGVFPSGAVALLGRGDTSALLVTARGASRLPIHCRIALHFLRSTGSDPIVLDSAAMRFATLTERGTCRHEASIAHLAGATFLDVSVFAQRFWTLERRQNRLTLRSYNVMDTVSVASATVTTLEVPAPAQPRLVVFNGVLAVVDHYLPLRIYWQSRRSAAWNDVVTTVNANPPVGPSWSLLSSLPLASLGDVLVLADPRSGSRVLAYKGCSAAVAVRQRRIDGLTPVAFSSPSAHALFISHAEPAQVLVLEAGTLREADEC
ncbi:MAG: hypothetical protein K2R93_06450 [Gemmatimonadaceae bacterium]|nr:hypothetical protein [Gemmatimonadaceae bacterium]